MTIWNLLVTCMSSLLQLIKLMRVVISRSGSIPDPYLGCSVAGLTWIFTHLVILCKPFGRSTLDQSSSRSIFGLYLFDLNLGFDKNGPIYVIPKLIVVVVVGSTVDPDLFQIIFGMYIFTWICYLLQNWLWTHLCLCNHNDEGGVSPYDNDEGGHLHIRI